MFLTLVELYFHLFHISFVTLLKWVLLKPTVGCRGSRVVGLLGSLLLGNQVPRVLGDQVEPPSGGIPLRGVVMVMEGVGKRGEGCWGVRLLGNHAVARVVRGRGLGDDHWWVEGSDAWRRCCWVVHRRTGTTWIWNNNKKSYGAQYLKKYNKLIH